MECAVVRVRIPMKPLVDVNEMREDSKEEEGVQSDVPQEIDVIEDRVKLVHTRREDLSVFVLHQAAQRFLRREFAVYMKSIRGYEHVNPDKLMEHIVKKAEAIEAAVMEEIGNGLPIFDFEIN